MLFSFALFSSFLLTSAVLADRRRERRQFGFLNRLEQPTHAASDTIEYSTNWAGAVWYKEDVRCRFRNPCPVRSHQVLFRQGTFTSVTGTFTAPVPSGDIGTAASAWVGIDGSSCSGNTGLLQTGIDFAVTDNGPAYGGKETLTKDSRPISFIFFANSLVRVVPRRIVLFLRLRHLRWRRHQSHR